jgi:16S rRNA (cytidine1402-2'-O)-methyltransferase
MGILSVIATPIGNLGDITVRGIDTLRIVDAIACEDTRVTSKLLARYDISKPLLVYHARSGKLAATRILSQLAEGKHIALVTDAGTPGISDPGSELVSIVRERLGSDVRIESVPGPSALTAALSIAGVPTDEFTFFGFLPHKKGRQTLMRAIAESPRTCIFYESPHRLMKALGELDTVLPEREVIVLRELTKMFESRQAGTPSELTEYFNANLKEVRGELVIIVPAA